MQNKTDKYTEAVEDNLGPSEKKLLTELKSKNDEIISLKEQLAGTQQYVNDFVYIAAHALKSPVANLNLINILLDKTNDIDEVKSYLETMKSSVKRLDQTIQGMVLGFQVAAIDDNATLISFSSLVDSVIGRVQGNLNSMPIKILGTFDACPQIFYKRNILFEILSNLIQNAIDNKSEQQGLHIEIKSERHGETVLLQVTDNGIGMDLEKHSKDLFQPFKKLSSCANGNGMGLYLAKALVEKSDGKIEIESELNVGTTVRCYLKEHQKNL